MTVRGKLEEMLVKNGMFESQAKEVIDLSIPVINELAGGYEVTFDAPAKDYPPVLYGWWFQTIKPIALKWIIENKPNAWFRAMFEETQA